MRTTAVKKPAVKTSCHGCSCREDALVNPCQNSRKPRQTTTPTQSGYLRSHQQVPTVATPTRATNLRSRLCAWVDDAETERLPLHHRIPTCLGGRRRQRAATSTPSHPCVPGWTTLTPSSYLHSIASAHGSASQIQKIVQENTSQIKNTSLPDKENFPQHQALSFVKDFRRGGR